MQFLPAADALIACLHSSQVVVLSGAEFGQWAVTCIVATSILPFRRLVVLAPDTVIAAGFDFFPVKIQKRGTGWKITAEGKQPKVEAAEVSEIEKARLRFQNEANLGQKEAVALPKTRHGNTITS